MKSQHSTKNFFFLKKYHQLPLKTPLHRLHRNGHRGLDKVVIACDERIAAKAAGLDQRPLTRSALERTGEVVVVVVGGEMVGGKEVGDSFCLVFFVTFSKKITVFVWIPFFCGAFPLERGCISPFAKKWISAARLRRDCEALRGLWHRWGDQESPGGGRCFGSFSLKKTPNSTGRKRRKKKSKTSYLRNSH